MFEGPMIRRTFPLFALFAFSTAHAAPTRTAEPAPTLKPQLAATAKPKAAPIKATIAATASPKLSIAYRGAVFATQTSGGPPPPPPPKGWPHAVQTATTTSCGRDPAPNEVIVYLDTQFAGLCSVLAPGFYPYADNLLVGNDAISSIKVGSAVRARAFRDAVYGGGWTVYPPSSMNGGLGAWNDTISSFRVEPASRSETCDDIQDGEIALYENSYMHGDCVVLPADGSYPNAETMGIANDSISSMKNISTKTLTAFWDASFGGYVGVILPSYTLVNELPGDGFLTKGIDNNISSIQVQ
jgi:hypothetical protein